MEWLFWQVGGLGPMLGQHGHFRLYAPERIAYATERYRAEALRLYGVLDRQLARREPCPAADTRLPTWPASRGFRLEGARDSAGGVPGAQGMV
jgi:glutathione S-transferase